MVLVLHLLRHYFFAGIDVPGGEGRGGFAGPGHRVAEDQPDPVAGAAALVRLEAVAGGQHQVGAHQHARAIGARRLALERLAGLQVELVLKGNALEIEIAGSLVLDHGPVGEEGHRGVGESLEHACLVQVHLVVLTVIGNVHGVPVPGAAGVRGSAARQEQAQQRKYGGRGLHKVTCL